jgi:acyl-CoA reductase-like NAD-dependent aldehyde dehydrogenase
MTEERPEANNTPTTEAMRRANAAFAKWAAVPPERRAEHFGELRRRVLQQREAIARTVCSEAAKTEAEAMLSDLLPTLEMLRYLERHAARVLRPRKAPTPLLFGPGSSRVEYRPRGVVLIIGPWNNPFQLAMVPAAFALAAGNAVVLKPSERSPETGRRVGALCREAGFADGLVEVVPGGPEVAQALIEERPAMVFFTGGVRGGQAVGNAAARLGIPAVLELGGKDPMLVFADADPDRAAQAAVYGAFAHAGQHCVSVKRLFVEDGIYEPFLEQVAERARRLAATGEWGRVADERAAQLACEQVGEALDAGARLLLPQDRGQAGHQPTLLAEAAPTMRVMQEETFAPVLAACRFEGEAEAVRLANASPFGLNASVWTRDPARAERVVGGLETGNVAVNGVLINIGNPHLPFGGVKASGMGRYHGPEGLRSFCRETAVTLGRSRRRTEPNWFPHDAARMDTVERMMELRYGDLGWFRRIGGWLRLLRRLG